jgi:hypothetical protein
LDHAENSDLIEEDSVDRLWLVIRSLKSPEGKYVILNLFKEVFRITKSRNLMLLNLVELSLE